MLIFIISDNKPFRQTRLIDVMESLTLQDPIVLDDTMIGIDDLEQYIYPSLFTITTPVIHGRFLLDGKASELTAEKIKKLSASPTVFIFEEFALPAAVATLSKKHGATLHRGEKTKAAKKEHTIFSVTNALTASDKKSRWIAYQEAIMQHPAEAVIGILYWKVRDMLAKGPAKDRPRLKKLYTELLLAHTRAWESGAPLELLIEKVLLLQ